MIGEENRPCQRCDEITAELSAVKAERDALKLTGRKLNPVIRERDALAAELEQVKAELDHLKNNSIPLESFNVSIPSDEWYDTLKERDALLAERDELIRRLEPSEPTYESALGEIDYLHDLEQMVGKDAIANQTLRRANEALERQVAELIDDNCDILVKCEQLRAALQRAVGYVERNGFGVDRCEVWEQASQALATAGRAKERGE